MALSPKDVLAVNANVNQKYVDAAIKKIDENLRKGNLTISLSCSTLVKEEVKEIYKRKGWKVKVGDHTIMFDFPST